MADNQQLFRTVINRHQQLTHILFGL